MSVKISALAWSARLPKVNGPKGASAAVEKLVLLRLADVANDDGSSIYPSRDRIALDCELGKDAVRSAIDQLVTRGILQLVRGHSGLHRRSAEYRINLDALRACIEKQEPTEEAAAPIERNDHTAEIPANETIERNSHSAEIPDHIERNYLLHTAEFPAPIERQFRPQPSLEPSLDPSLENMTRAIPDADRLPLLDVELPIEMPPPAKPKRKAKPSGKWSPEDEASFAGFYAACPRREDPPAARKAYAAAIKRGASAGQLLIAMRRYAEHMAAQGTEKQWIKTPGPWLNAERYRDEIPDAIPDQGHSRPSHQSGRREPPGILDSVMNAVARLQEQGQ